MPVARRGVRGGEVPHPFRLLSDTDKREELTDEAMARIRGPVGMDLEAVTAPEIALSIIAELVAVRRGSPLGTRRPKS